MQPLASKLSPQHILCLGAHCDDIEIGCGATILKLTADNPDIKITWVVFTSSEQRKKEAEAGAQLFAGKAKNLDIQIYNFRDGFLPYEGVAVKEKFESLKQQCQPDLIFTHYRDDLHQDHAKISELTWNTFRSHLILEYEIPKWDGDLGKPNNFVHIDKAIGQQKIDYLQQAYNSQSSKQWFTDDLFWSLMRLRGMESNSPSQIAEGFYNRKMSLAIE